EVDDKGGMSWKEVEQRFDQVAFRGSYGHDDHESFPTIDASQFGCDKDMDGKTTKEDFKQMIILSVTTNKLDMKQEEAEHFASMIMLEVDTQQKGYIEFYQLKQLFKTTLTKGYLSKEQNLTEYFKASSYDHLSIYQDNFHQEQHIITKSLPEILFRTYWRRAWIVTLWLIVCITLFTWKFIQYKHRAAFQVMGYCLSTAKGAAETLKFNMALILLPVCRILVTWLRRSPRISSVIPFNDTINVHKTWMYLAIPVLLYSGERIYRSIRSEIHEVDVLQANMYPGKVLHLKFSKPATFTYSSGMYILIKCPQVSPLEWHPFSLTSGPNDNHLSIHVRTLGDWSYQIHNLFHQAMMSKPFDYPKVYIDGPYGAASQDHVKYEVVVLIGLGIGATPFISVLKDIGDRLHKPSFNQVIIR
uniref:FAD-binding FR-type domain-containing protein n=1 Tax=Chenopodium quinoa TaxID=63459 RepID=A0A803M0T1_CHEQI